MTETINFPSTATETMCVFARPTEGEDTGFKILLVSTLHKYFMQDEDINIGEVEITYKLPGGMTHIDLVKLAIDTIQEKASAAMAEAVKRDQKYKEMINQLQRLTYQPEF